MKFTLKFNWPKYNFSKILYTLEQSWTYKPILVTHGYDGPGPRPEKVIRIPPQEPLDV